MLPVKRYVAMNTFCRSMTYYQKSYSLQLKGIHPLRKRKKPKTKKKKTQTKQRQMFYVHFTLFFLKWGAPVSFYSKYGTRFLGKGF
jgi:hypothetical protein